MVESNKSSKVGEPIAFGTSQQKNSETQSKHSSLQFGKSDNQNIVEGSSEKQKVQQR